ncbi:MAG: type II toxin-antitoxin system PemK/MazF family toxin [Candidatus Moeniiplasma glomeromycotorum]|nr:type II toxin-antitoxin system PemK/MazF family toxin [Candidatus Moeniiplasma glomeromycotorum]MCE8167124.1 type II toxin-antitoxin system PemK/MazF family toxin [Candidatus Moeniiplasma glomeromycotorum]MCE8168864.1 type II toxin-antitoxin system PemK/MazF family toxin [Candidatus Moeniiplasma glomeromycotorum]
MSKKEPSYLKPKRGEFWLIRFKKVEDNKSIRSCLIISGNIQNEFDERIVVAGTTTKGLEKIEPFEVFIENTLENGLDKPSKILLNYPRTIRKSRLEKSTFLGVASPEVMKKVKLAWKVAFDWND